MVNTEMTSKAMETEVLAWREQSSSEHFGGLRIDSPAGFET